ncbi:Hsp70 family protein [Oxalicibacterium faecigallinarum]|uniref:Heat-shock protein n=1 Tax=Oxalicibacterium faecigallinarum TaxID=573741 RepID=A0A8J3ASQ5_9BURK|nr:Hsp70 family protein [Oxalicibacterium faecigallinarum]GGI17970.1 heat-shock protein [Oxalicibacterium faecigallinarum]
MANACGVDFGTSNSTVGWARPGSSPLLVLEDGKVTLPSVVFFNADEEQVYYGRAALSNYLEGYEGRLMRSLKSLLGTSLIDDQTEVMGKVLPFRTLLTQFISELKHRAEQAAGREFSSAVLGRPVHFVDGNEEADTLAEDTLYEIAQSVGFKEIDFQFEPIAAAFDYEAQLTREELVLIVDIGGGTSDFSLVRLSPERARQADRRHDILATGGVHIGGTDFDKYLSLNSIMPLLGMGSRLNSGVEVPSSYFYNLATWHTINLTYTQKTYLQIRDIYRDATEKNKLDTLLDLIENRSGHWLAIKAEEGKIALSSDVQTELHLDRLRPVQSLLLDRAVFEQAIDHLVTEIEATVAALLRDADIHVDDIDTVVFTGGSSGVRLLREKVAALLPNAKRVEGDLFGSIGAGLALDAERKFG